MGYWSRNVGFFFFFFLRGIYEFASTETWKSTDPPAQVYPPRPTISSSPSIAYKVEASKFQGRAFFQRVPGTCSLRGTWRGRGTWWATYKCLMLNEGHTDGLLTPGAGGGAGCFGQACVLALGWAQGGFRLGQAPAYTGGLSWEGGDGQHERNHRASGSFGF